MSKPIEGKIRIVVVDDVDTSRTTLARLLSFEPDMDVIGLAGTGAEAIEKAKELQPDVMLMDINMPDIDGLTATGIITKSVPVAVVMISVQSDRDYIRRALQVGATDFLSKPPSADELYEAVRRAYERRPQPVVTTIAGTSAADAQIAGKVIVVYSPQGGAGVTTMAINIAAGLVGKETQTALVDANLQFGDVSIQLDLSNDRSISDLAAVADDLDTEFVDNVLTTHGSGIRILAAPPRPENADEVSAENLIKVVKSIANRHNFVVVDTAPHLDDVSISLFEMADMVVLVGLPTLPSVKNVRFILDLLDKIDGMNRNKIFFVLNQIPADKRSGALEPSAISSTLKLPVNGVVPYVQKPMLDAINRGVPAIANARQTPGQELQEVVNALRAHLEPKGETLAEEAGSEARKRRGLFS